MNLATAAEDEAREMELALRSVPEADKEQARSFLRGGIPVGADDPEMATHLQRIAVLRTARMRHEFAQQTAAHRLPSVMVRLAIVDTLPMKDAKAVVLLVREDGVDGTILIPSVGATGADVDLAVRALQRSLKSPKSNATRARRIAIRATAGANAQAATYWSGVIDSIKQHRETELSGVGAARFTLVKVR